jgi:hypothetical protein
LLPVCSVGVEGWRRIGLQRLFAAVGLDAKSGRFLRLCRGCHRQKLGKLAEGSVAYVFVNGQDQRFHWTFYIIYILMTRPWNIDQWWYQIEHLYQFGVIEPPYDSVRTHFDISCVVLPHYVMFYPVEFEGRFTAFIRLIAPRTETGAFRLDLRL